MASRWFLVLVRSYASSEAPTISTKSIAPLIDRPSHVGVVWWVKCASDAGATPVFAVWLLQPAFMAVLSTRFSRPTVIAG